MSCAIWNTKRLRCFHQIFSIANASKFHRLVHQLNKQPNNESYTSAFAKLGPFLQSQTSPEPNKTQRMINLAQTREYLEQFIPQMLTTQIDESRVSEQVILRVCPVTYPMIPVIKGRNSFILMNGLLRKLATRWVHPVQHVHIVSSTVEEPSHKINVASLNRAAVDEIERDLALTVPVFEGPHHAYSLFPWTYKVVIKWRTCTDECHLMNKPVDRVLSGVFVFELCLDNSRVWVHSIEDLELITGDEIQKTDVALL